MNGAKAHLVARRGLAHVTEDRSLFFQLTVAENLRLGAAKGSADLDTGARRTSRPWKVCSIGEAGLLSGGEQQMLAMAGRSPPNPSC